MGGKCKRREKRLVFCVLKTFEPINLAFGSSPAPIGKEVSKVDRKKGHPMHKRKTIRFPVFFWRALDKKRRHKKMSDGTAEEKEDWLNCLPELRMDKGQGIIKMVRKIKSLHSSRLFDGKLASSEPCKLGEIEAHAVPPGYLSLPRFCAKVDKKGLVSMHKPCTCVLVILLKGMTLSRIYLKLP